MRGMRSAYSGVCVCRRRARRHTYVGCAHGRAAERLRAARGGSESGAKGRSKLRFPAVRGRGRDRGPGEGLRGREGTPRAPGAAPREARGRSAPPLAPATALPLAPPPRPRPPRSGSARSPRSLHLCFPYLLFFPPPPPPHPTPPTPGRFAASCTERKEQLRSGSPVSFTGGGGGGEG